MQTIIQKILNFWFPHTCLICHAPCSEKIDLCSICENELPFLQHTCQQCGKVIPKQIKACGQCLKNPPPFQTTIALCQYKEPIIKLITNLKFHHQLNNAKVLGILIAKQVNKKSPNDLPEYLLPVPLHKRRLKERGFNQSTEIARFISTELHIPIDQHSCIRIKNTKAQTLIPAKERHKNIKNAFVIKENFKAEYVAIIDDVVTTGNTATELSRALKKAGVERVDIWCCARAQR